MRLTRQTMVLAALILIAAILLCMFCLFPMAAPSATDPVLETEAQDWDASAMAPASPVPGIQIPGYDTVYFPEGADEVPMTLYNPQDNPCYFVFTLFADGAEEPLYTSDYIEPGKAVTQIQLSQRLAAGEHSLTIHIDTYALDTVEPLNNAEVQALLMVV